VVGPGHIPLVIAGGGGGGGTFFEIGTGIRTPNPGGGGLTGPDGGGALTFPPYYGLNGSGGPAAFDIGFGGGGGGGFLSAGGSSLNGVTGGAAWPDLAGGNTGGGFGGGGGETGGGGGYSGGASGAFHPITGADPSPGLGGGSFDAGTDQILIADWQTGNGEVVISIVFAGTPGTPTCRGKVVSTLAKQYGGLDAAAAALGYSSVQVLRNAIAEFCAG
jgi:hypothetical protein